MIPLTFDRDGDVWIAAHVATVKRLVAPLGYRLLVQRWPAFTGPWTVTIWNAKGEPCERFHSGNGRVVVEALRLWCESIRPANA